ncbi:MAG: hypothetical protein RLZZ241_2527 [Bacteroidota bacterium]|jgi:hypothetical protein
MKQIFGTILALLFLASCQDGPKKKYKPQSLGALNTVAVVMDDHMWKGPVGDQVRELFAAPQIGLTWDEPQFSLEHIPPSVFKGTTRHRRSVLYVSLDTISGAQIREDLYAAPQRVGVIKAVNDSILIQTVATYADRIMSAIRDMELGEAQQRFLRSLSKDTILSDKFGITMRLPSVYKVGKQEENFVWIDREIQKGSMNLVAYELPGSALKNDSTLVSDIVRLRDSIGQLYIPGPDVPNKITYMGTEKAFAPAVFQTEFNGMQAIEVRGIWEIVNYPMAGPFLTYIIKDPKQDRYVVLEGFTFAPATNKRDYMFELEAIIKTAEIRN